MDKSSSKKRLVSMQKKEPPVSAAGATRKRLLLVDDHVSAREMMALVLKREGRWDIVGSTHSGLMALELCKTLNPDVLVLDLMLPEMAGTEVLRKLRAEMPQQRVLVYTGTLSPALMAQALEYHPHGYVEKGDSLAMLREALEAVSLGCGFYTPMAAQWMSAQSGKSSGAAALSSREREIVKWIAQGLNNKAIASKLGISTKTIENHRSNVMLKLGLRDMASLTKYAVKHGLVDLE